MLYQKMTLYEVSILFSNPDLKNSSGMHIIKELTRSDDSFDDSSMIALSEENHERRELKYFTLGRIMKGTKN